jgi:hypothetical protein
MTDIRKWAFVGLMSLGLVSIGCASKDDNSGSGGSNGSGGSSSKGGSNGSGGSSSKGGSNGSGGSSSSGSGGSSSSGSGGSSSSGSGGASAACATPTAALITDFGTGTYPVGTPYKGADTGLTVPTVDTSSGALVINVATGAPSTMYPYAYVGLPFNSCVNASSYTGVKFNISGTLNTGCTIQFSVVDEEHSTTTNSGTCVAGTTGCYASAKIFTLPSAATDVTINFTDQTGGGSGMNATAAAVDPTEILNVQWQFNVPVGDASGGCTGMVTIDNITFN